VAMIRSPRSPGEVRGKAAIGHKAGVRDAAYTLTTDAINPMPVPAAGQTSREGGGAVAHIGSYMHVAILTLKAHGGALCR